MTTKPFELAVVIGRMQPFHLGHAALLQAALERADRVLVVLGSSYSARSSRNPFTVEERATMIRATLSSSELDRVLFAPVRDYADDQRWNAAVRASVSKLNVHPGKTVLVGFEKDATSYYLQHFPDWHQHRVERSTDIDATALRKVLFETDNLPTALSVIRPYVHASVAAYLAAWAPLPVFKLVADESRAVAADRAAYGAGPHLTADAVVRIGDYVLLVRRAGPVGKGLWAIPGGFVELGEHTLTAALRELREETCFPWLDTAILAGKQGELFSQHPGRSARGRVLSHAFYFRFEDMPLPEVRASSDAKTVRWFHVDELPGLETQLFEDHAIILDRFLGGVLSS